MTSAPDDPRRDALSHWIAQTLAPSTFSLAPASADASFRRYFRVTPSAPFGGDATLIAMDAPPPTENCAPFVTVAALLRDAGLNAPRIVAQDLARGFLLVTDLGTTTYLQALRDGADATALFDDATDALVRWQSATRHGVLPRYDAALLRRELELFPQWYLGTHLRYRLGDDERAALDRTFDRIVAANLAQGVVYVHRDYMPRNLMVATPNPGILDFQDAVEGPVSYDVASLFRDAFASFDDAFVHEGTARYWTRARQARLPVRDDFATFWNDVVWMGLQRHLKVLGIFARLFHRDGKRGYVEDTPRFLRYVRAVTAHRAELDPLARLLDRAEAHAQRAQA